MLKSGEEKYSRGWRGAPAKGVGRETGARVQIPLSPLKEMKWAIQANRTVRFIFLFPKSQQEMPLKKLLKNF